jgi:SAM-dependent methyltransferase
MQRLNLGCGEQVAVGWVNVDRRQPEVIPPGADVLLADLRGRLPFESYRFDSIVAHHVLDMLEQNELVVLLLEVERLLAPDGVFRITSPDIAAGIRAWQDNDADWFPNRTGQIDSQFCAWLTWYGTRRTLFTIRSITPLLQAAGLETIVAGSAGTLIGTISNDREITSLDTRIAESITIEAAR